jgi:hypothetical protein
VTLTLVDDVKNAWKWLSMWLIAMNGTFIVAYNEFQPLQQYIPPKTAHWIILTLLAATAIGRILKQYDDSNAQPPAK